MSRRVTRGSLNAALLAFRGTACNPQDAIEEWGVGWNLYWRTP